jgi:hypothetical protein
MLKKVFSRNRKPVRLENKSDAIIMFAVFQEVHQAFTTDFSLNFGAGMEGGNVGTEVGRERYLKK